MADTSQVKELTKRLEDGIKTLFASDNYADYLKTMSRFHNYSTRNTMLIHMQMPQASLVAGFGAWQKKFERHVLKGAKSIKILAPTPFVIREEKAVLDPESRLPVLDEKGMPVVEQIERKLARFKVVSVFDVSQTDGKPIPSIVQDLTGDVEQYAAFMDTLREVSPLPIVFEALPEDTDGICHFGDRIAIRLGMSEVQTVSAVIHEITHARLHDLVVVNDAANTAPPKDRNTEEVEAESVSYVVCQYFGIETGENSFGYLASWSADRELKQLNASLNTIRKTASEMIDEIDARFHEIAQERGIVFSVGEEQASLFEVAPEYMTAPDTEPPSTPAAVSAPPVAVTPRTAAPAGTQTRVPGEVVLMPLLYEDGNLNRIGRRTRVTVEPPVGQYAVYSHEEGGTKYLYLPTASGMLVQAGEAERLKSLTEQQIAEFFSRSADALEQQLADPDTWADFSAAAIANRIADAEAHNIPVRDKREAEQTREAQERHAREEAIRLEREQIFTASVDELADKIISGEKADVERDHYRDKHPMLALFEKYGVEVPLATKGWINRNLRAFQLQKDGTVSMWLPKSVKASDTFSHAVRALKSAIEKERAAQRGAEAVAPPAQESATADTESALYQKIAALYPRFMSGEFCSMWLETTKGGRPLYLEWAFNDRISIMHKSNLPSGVGWQPKLSLRVDSAKRTVTADSLEFADPPRYDFVYDEQGRPDVARQRNIHDFAAQWLDKLDAMAFRPMEATFYDKGVAVPVTFDADGGALLPDGEFLPPGQEDATPYWKAHDIIGVLEDGGARLTTEDKNCIVNYAMKTGAADTAWTLARELADARANRAGGQAIQSILSRAVRDIQAVQPENAAQTEPTPATEPIRAQSTPSDASLPDPTLTASDRNAYGYTADEMLPLATGRAAALFEDDHTIYLLYPDDTEAMAFDRDEILTHDGLCGIDRADWEASPIRAAQLSAAANSEGAREAELLHGDGDRFGIYQIAGGQEMREYIFESYSRLDGKEFPVNRGNYELIYTAPLESADSPNSLYDRFHTAKPADYTGRSLSVSDVVVLQRGGEVTAHYVDAFGLKELSTFTGEEKAPTAGATAPSYSQVGNSPTVAQLEADAHNGKPISLMALSRAVAAEQKPIASKRGPTLSEQLAEGKRMAAAQGQPPQKPNEREERA